MTQAPTCPDPHDLERLARGQLPGPAAEKLGRHVLDCSCCAQLLGEFQTADSLVPDLRAAPGQQPPDDPFVDSLMERLMNRPPGGAAGTATSMSDTLVGSATAAAGPLPALPGYEVLEVLGRGGQSVVYKARQRALDRLVALKMIVSSAPAEAEERARFRREAEAVAQLVHPHIVQIYDVGEHAGQPYLALEYVPGGTLAQKLAGVPLAGREAARLLETLARAVHWAHQRGIVHRDLKPGNVRVTADGALKIADFGLAKRLEADASLTHTGYVMGTPSYMAPEQASGKSKEVGPAADVYALGVILYEMLTGRPPFLGVTAWDIIPQVLQADPVPPRRLQPGVLSDLETICLKCLHKEPQKRYDSALDLAEDLRCFQAGQPIKARPVGLPERLLKWVKRRPAVASLTAAVAVLVLAGLVTSQVLAAWAFRERNRAEERLEEASRADRRRVQAQVEQLGTAAPEAVPGLLAALKEERQAVLPRLRELWADLRGPRQRRMRAGLALADDDLTVRKALAGWMIEVEDPREVLLMREVLRPYGANMAQGLWQKVSDPKVRTAARFRALVALAAFDPANGRWRKAAPTAVEHLLKANPRFLGLWMQALRPARGRLLGFLGEVFRGEHEHLADQRLLASTVLAEYAADRPRLLADLLMDADEKQFAVLFQKALAAGEAVVSPFMVEVDRQLPAQAPEQTKERLAKRQVNAMVALLRLGRPEKLRQMLMHRPDPRARTYLIHRLGPLGVLPDILVRHLENEPNVSIRRALVLSLGEFGKQSWTPGKKQRVVKRLQAVYRTTTDPGLHAAAEWLLRKWHEEQWLEQINEAWARDRRQRARRLEGLRYELTRAKPRPQWYVNGQGQTMVVIPGPVQFVMGSPLTESDRLPQEYPHRQRIGQTFALAAKAVTVKQFLRFWSRFSKKEFFYSNIRAPADDCPVHSVDWYTAAAYCNWLSAQENIPQDQWCYQTGPEERVTKLKEKYLTLTGYRLPTEAEWEYACRAGARTSRYFGASAELLGKYAWYVENVKDRTWPVGGKKPNDLGFFDMHGNVYCWCQESYKDYARTKGAAPVEDVEDELEVIGTAFRMLRGGSFINHASYLRSAVRLRVVPAYHNVDVGFRPARTLVSDRLSGFAPRPAGVTSR
jgi:formylglycine-generating enzyme required for sulfatase activity/tRNA A-37 threonylcarbamoyl transferase component Bud32